jgi:hypothetical protein
MRVSATILGTATALAIGGTSAVFATSATALPFPGTSPATHHSLQQNVSAYLGHKRLHLNPTLHAGQTITVEATGFTSREPVTLRLASAPTQLIHQAADSAGRVVYTLPVGAHHPGADVLTIVGQGPQSSTPGSGNLVTAVPEHAVFPFSVAAPKQKS